MKVLVVGGFSLIGQAVLRELIVNKHQVTVIAMLNKRTRKIAKAYKAISENILWNAFDHKSILMEAIIDAEVVIFIGIDSLPIFTKKSTNEEQYMRKHFPTLLEIVEKANTPKKLVFVSRIRDLDIMINQESLALKDQLLNQQKTEMDRLGINEALLVQTSIKYTIMRLGFVLPSSISYPSYDRRRAIIASYEISLNNRIDLVLDVDVATAINNAAELLVSDEAIDNKVFMIGGGKKHHCQWMYKDFLTRVYKEYGLKMPREDLFAVNDEPVKWLDTRESQYFLDYQNHDFNDYIKSIRRNIRFIKPLIRIFRPLINIYLEGMSPYKK